MRLHEGCRASQIEAVKNHDARGLTATAHHISGSTGSLSAKALHHISRQLDEAGKAGQFDEAALHLPP
ncbi:MAG: hypothetical protein Q7U28_03355 [Aquabacterium sp.]|nr:hypothetical protein [Aquabacterium sp.]